jgi:uncharacterized membrane protein (UPF0127 family)
MRRRAVLTLMREDGRVVADSVVVADTTWRRLRGALGWKRLESGTGILLRPAWSIHTAFMRFPMDVVFIDPDQVVLRVDPKLGPFKTASCRGAREVVELAAGEAARRGLRVGDRVAWAPRAPDAAATESSHPAHGEPRATVLIASRDGRFIKLTRFLLEGRALEVRGFTAPQRIAEGIADVEADVIILDAHTELADALRSAHAARARRPELPILIAAEGDAGARHSGVRVYDKWNETEELIDAVERELGERDGGAAPQLEVS